MNNKTTRRREATYALPVVILAAGEGCRLQAGNGGKPKPLTRLLGLTFLERAVLSCREAGCEEFYVVTGCYGDKLLPYINGLGRRYDISVRAVYNPDWPQGNGTSALAVSRYIAGPFLLVMCDHLFDPDIIRDLTRAGNGGDSCLLAVDRNGGGVFDLKDATKVCLDGRRVTAIGKGLAPFDAVDTGLFLCRPFLFDALAEAGRGGDGSLSGGVRRLVEEGRVGAVDVADRFWLDVDTPESLSLGKKHLLAGLAKRGDDGIISRRLNRPLSRRISQLLAATPLTPNAITVLSFLSCLGGAFLFSLGIYGWTVAAGFLVQWASVLDGCDGEVARLKFQGSRFGAWFDTVLDRYADVAVVMGISYGYWLGHPRPLVWLAGAVALTGFVLASYTKKEYALRFRLQPPGGVLSNLAKRDVRLFAIFLGALVNRPFEVMVLVGLLSHTIIGWLFFAVYRQRRSRRARS
ncbi:MAG: NTP transferase domain-containing protein [bacterium]